MRRFQIFIAPILAAALLFAGCSGGSSSSSKKDPADPAFSAASFSNPTQVDNTYMPLTPDTARAYQTETEDGVETIVTEVLDTTRMVSGVECVVFRDRVYLDDLLIEDTHDWFAQDDEGNVWYMGEEVINYEYDDEDNLIGTNDDGAWKAGVDGAVAGILIKRDPVVGDSYQQEYLAGEAEDMAEVVALNVTVTLMDGTVYDSCVKTREWTPLEPGAEEYKYYAPDVGLVREETVDGEEAVELKGTFLTNVDEVPDFSAASFTNPTVIDNTYLPLIPDTTHTYQAETEDGEETIVTEVLDTTRMVSGVECVVFRDRVYLDDLLIEDTHDWFAQDDEGNVWYMGEEVINYEYDDEDNLISTNDDGAWEAGVDGALPGILMWANPQEGVSYYQEYYEGEAEDMGMVVATGVEVDLEDGTTYEDCLQILDWTPLEPNALEYKYYAPDMGLIREEDVTTGEGMELVQTEAETPLKEGKLLIEHNATDEDTGFQGFADGDPWNELSIKGPGDETILTVTPVDGLFNFGLTELFFETSEPENAEVPIVDVLSRLSEGEYTFTGDMVEEEESSVTTPFSHHIPAGPVLKTPADGLTGVDPENVVITWDTVSKDIDGSDITVVGYQVIVEKDEEPQYPQGFARSLFSVHLPATVTSVTVPTAFMEDNACYQYEVLAIEASGNQTLASAGFETGSGCETDEPEEDDTPKMKDAKLLIEHNATDEDTGFQGFADGDPWNELIISRPDGQSILMVEPEGGFYNFGLTELFFETSEPENDVVSIDDVLARLPEGTYTFTGDMVDGEPSSLTTTFAHNIPKGPELDSPADGSTGVDPDDVVVSWREVTEDINGSDITIVGYQVIVEEDEEPQYPQGFARPLFSVHLPASARNVRVPAEFMESETDYAYEVLAIEESGNQTLSSAEFTTK